MATAFAFPASPTLGQIASLPDGNQAQWNGYAWVEVGQAGVTYPITVALGGTGATTAANARINLGLNTATGEFIVQKDGTVAAPGIAFASEPGLGWYRKSAATFGIAAGGGQTFEFGAGGTTATNFAAWPRVTGNSGITLFNQPVSAANYNYLSVSQGSDGSANITTGKVGTATRGNLTLDAPNVISTGSLTLATGTVIALSKTGQILWQNTTNNGSLTASVLNFGESYDGGGGNAVVSIQSSPAGMACAINFRHHPGVDAGTEFTMGGVLVAKMTNSGDFVISGATAQKQTGTTWANPSSRSIKHDIEDYPLGIDAILQVRPRTYRLNDAPERLNVGIVADEVEGPFPQSISYDANGMPLFQADPVIWALVNSVKTLHQRLKAIGA